MEITNLFIQILIFFILSFFPFFYILKPTKIIKNYNLINIFGINFILVLNLILFISFFNPNKEILYLSLLFISLISMSLSIIKNKKIFNLSNILIALFLFLFLFFICVDIANNFNFTWDVKKYYLPKATAFYESYFVNDFIKKAEYPYFGSYLWAFFWKNSFLEYEYFGRMAYAYIYILSIFYFLNLTKIRNIFKIILSILLIFISYKSQLFDGRPDILIFSYFLFTGKHLFELFHNNKNNIIDFLIIIFSLNLILWTKSEGLAYVLIVYFSIIFFLQNNRNMKLFLTFAIFSLIIIKYLFYYYYGLSLNPNVETFNYEIINKINIEFITSRSFQIIVWYLMYFLTNPIMIISLLVFLATFIYAKEITKKFNYLYSIFILKFSVIFVTYLLTYYPMPFHLKYSLDRIIFHSSGLFLIIVLFYIDKFLKKKLN